MTVRYTLAEIKPDDSNAIIRLVFYPHKKAKFSVFTVTPEGYEQFESAFFCLLDANALIYKLVEG